MKRCDKENNEGKSVTLNSGDIFFASVGTKHVAPQDETRILVVKHEGRL